MTGVQDGSYPDISFAGCGFIGIYHVGVSACLSAYAPQLLKQRILGSSAGGLQLIRSSDLSQQPFPLLVSFSLCTINLMW